MPQEKLLGYSGLIFTCPHGKEHPKCSFSDIRKRANYQSAKEWLNMTYESRFKLVNHHIKCSNQRRIKVE